MLLQDNDVYYYILYIYHIVLLHSTSVQSCSSVVILFVKLKTIDIPNIIPNISLQ